MCNPCVAGRAQKEPRQTKCDICSPGTFSDSEHATACLSCKKGTFSDVVSSLKCDSCPQGYAINVSSSANCDRCPMRYKSNLEQDATTCIKCKLGEIQTPDTRTCWKCVAMTFSLRAGEQLPTEFDEDDSSLAVCHLCPEGAICRGGHHLKVLNSWWRSSNMSIVPTQCFEHLACQGASNNDRNLNIPNNGGIIEHNESCAPGYRGRLCHACAPGYGRETFDSCSLCPDATSNKFLMAFGLLMVVLILIFFIVFTVHSATDARSTASMMFKTMAAYGQVVGIASLFPYKWPPSVLYLFDVLESVTSVSDRILNTDCAMEADNRDIPLTYEKALLYVSLLYVNVKLLMFCCTYIAIYPLCSLL